jgi:hypothetical protein
MRFASSAKNAGPKYIGIKLLHASIGVPMLGNASVKKGGTIYGEITFSNEEVVVK